MILWPLPQVRSWTTWITRRSNLPNLIRVFTAGTAMALTSSMRLPLEKSWIASGMSGGIAVALQPHAALVGFGAEARSARAVVKRRAVPPVVVGLAVPGGDGLIV